MFAEMENPGCYAVKRKHNRATTNDDNTITLAPRGQESNSTTG